MMQQPEQTACAEDFDSSFDFHCELSNLNYAHGVGIITSVVWSVAEEPEGVRTGVVILQLGNGMTAKRFTVNYTNNDYTLKFLGKKRKVVSDYFGD